MKYADSPGPTKMRKNAKDPRHGTVNGYGNLKCRCERCTAAWAEAHREYMHAHPEQQERHRLAQRARYHARKDQA